MARLEPAVAGGSLLTYYQALWAPYHAAVKNILGATGTVLPIGDPTHGQPNAATFTTVGAEQVTFTWSEAPNAFDTPLDLRDAASFQGIIPVLTFNGTDEEADTPDAAYWSRVEGSSEKFSVGVWVKPGNNGANKSIFSKFDGLSGQAEWELMLRADEKARLNLYDDVDDKTAFVEIDAALSLDVWQMLVATYDSGVSALSAAADDITMYLDGATPAQSATNDAAYSGMVAGTYVTSIGANSTAGTSAHQLIGDIAGGPLGPFFVQKVLTADEVRNLYELGRAGLGL